MRHDSSLMLKTAIGLAGAWVALEGVAGAQTRIKPDFNVFSAEQDREIGQRSAQEAERQLPMLEDRSIEAYVDRVGQRLAAAAPGPDFDYRFRVVNASDINAFALPGGFMYLNRGLIEAAATEGQLAGVMAHEIAHVALRHGTSQATKAYLGQTGLGLLGRLFGRERPSTEKAIDRVGGFGLNALFLKFSRSAERDADVLGAQILARAGYDPTEMATFFETLRQRGAREPGKVERFFSTHPSPENRAARIQQEKRMLRVNPTPTVGGLGEVQAELRRMPAAAPAPQIVEGRSG